MSFLKMTTREWRTRAYEAMREGGEAFFLRDARGDDALWVSDYPRRFNELSRVEKRLLALQVRCQTDVNARLWYLDLTLEGYRALTDGMPTAPPPLPADERLHPAYALCRLLLAHPAPLDKQPLAPLRRVLKLACGGKDSMLDAIPALHADCAARLRKRLLLASAAGRALAMWIFENASDKEEPSC